MGAANPFLWWVGTCNVGFYGHQIPATIEFAEEVQGGDPAATEAYAQTSAARGDQWAHCVAEGGVRPQFVIKDRPVDVKILNCVQTCSYSWYTEGPTRLTMRCLDTGEAITVIGPASIRLPHPCIAESTLELIEEESVLVWRVNACRAPECGPWPQQILPNP